MDNENKDGDWSQRMLSDIRMSLTEIQNNLTEIKDKIGNNNDAVDLKLAAMFLFSLGFAAFVAAMPLAVRVRETPLYVALMIPATIAFILSFFLIKKVLNRNPPK